MSPMVPLPLTIEHALLGYLNQKPMYGYEISQHLANSEGLGAVWRLKQSQLYALLSKLEEKGYITAKEFKAFCNEVVPLARFDRFTYSGSDTLHANIEVANFSGNIIKNNAPNWYLTDKQGNTINSGTFNAQEPITINGRLAIFM